MSASPMKVAWDTAEHLDAARKMVAATRAVERGRADVRELLRIMAAEGVPAGARGLWEIRKVEGVPQFLGAGRTVQTILARGTAATIQNGGEIVMEDSLHELRKHLPAVLYARGRVLVTGLGLGCVVRGLLARRDVEQVDVVEVDSAIIALVWPSFGGDRRVHLIQGDAQTVPLTSGDEWDFAWHDLWTEDEHLQVLHGRVLERFASHVRIAQGAWAFPRWTRSRLRRARVPFLDGRRQELGS